VPNLSPTEALAALVSIVIIVGTIIALVVALRRRSN
jgi:hypothetical protein